jgi:hypothetical protein
MYLEHILDDKFKAFFEPGLNSAIVQKILSRATVTSDIQKKVYDILVQSIKKDPVTKQELSDEEKK